MLRSIRVICLAALLAACAAPPAAPTPTPAARPASRIAEDAARRLAVAAAAQGGPEREPARGTPQVSAAALTTWRAAGAAYDLPTIPALAPEAAVWAIALSGDWAGGMPAPGITPTPARYRTALVILDAATGEVIMLSYGL